MENCGRPRSCLGGILFLFAIIEQNALNYSVVFVRRSFFSSNRLTRLLSVPRNEMNGYSVRSLVDYIRPEGQYDSSTCFLRSTQLRVRAAYFDSQNSHRGKLCF